MRSMGKRLTRATLAAVLLSPAACNGLHLGDDPGRDARKETGPLPVLPSSAADRLAR